MKIKKTVYHSFFVSFTKASFALPNDFVILLNIPLPSAGPTPSPSLLPVDCPAALLRDFDEALVVRTAPSWEFVAMAAVELAGVVSLVSFSGREVSCVVVVKLSGLPL